MNGNNFATMILGQEDVFEKIKLLSLLNKKERVVINAGSIYKTTILKMFLEEQEINMDINYLVTACLMYNCCDIDKIDEFLSVLGFDDKFKKLCKDVIVDSSEKDDVGQILEVVDVFADIVLNDFNDEERSSIDAAIAHLDIEYSIRKNDYYSKFKQFILDMKGVTVDGVN